MAPPSTTLLPPSSDPIPASLLAQHDGTDPSKPIWLAIKGTVFDVSAKRAMYGPGAGYNVFAGKDGSVGLGDLADHRLSWGKQEMGSWGFGGTGGRGRVWRCADSPVTGKSSLKPEDAVADYTTLEPAEMKVLDQWYDFFSKVGPVVRWIWSVLM